MSLATPAAAFDLVRHFEGLRLDAYRDAAGFPTQGYGRLLSRRRERPLSDFPPIDLATAERWLAEDLRRSVESVRRLCPVPLGDHRIAALASFVFNVGAGNLEISSLRRCVRQGRHDEVPRQLARWVYAGACKLPGLVRRRRAEAELYAG